MRIAVTYENGNVFQHFGHCENFKIYDVEDGVVVNAQVLGTGGTGHEALAAAMAEIAVDVVICGGIGDGAQKALASCGIEICSGAEGDCDAAVAAYLAGELESAGVNCDHHHEEEDEESCDCGCGGNCGGGCGGGCGGCHPTMEGKNVGKTMRVHYRGTFNDGTQFDSSYDRGEPLEFVCGAGMMIRGFDMAVANMEVGEEVDVHLMPEEAYGLANPNNIVTFEIAQLPGSENLSVGQRVYMSNGRGQFPVTVVAKDDTTITLDANHEMAGKELNFHIQVVEII